MKISEPALKEFTQERFDDVVNDYAITLAIVDW